MNKKILLASALLAISLPAIAAERYRGGDNATTGAGQNGIHEQGTGLANPELKAENRGTGMGLQQNIEATSTDRRSGVSNAVREMLQAADRQGGIGERVREIARNYEEDNNKIEDGLKAIKNRGQFRKFILGPDFKKIGETEEMLARHTERLNELKQLSSQATTDEDRSLLEQRIYEMETIKMEIEKEVLEEQKGFSLFGWLNKLINKR
jgi:hypothetical protein